MFVRLSKTINSYLPYYEIIHKMCTFFDQNFHFPDKMQQDRIRIWMFLQIDKTFLFFLKIIFYTHGSHIQSLQNVVEEGVGKAVLQLKVAGSAELLTITCPSLSVAENMADLVDG